MWLLLFTACTPLTAWRSTLFLPPALPPDTVGAPMPGGEVAVGGSLSGRALGPGEDPLPQEGDPGLIASPLEVGVHGRFGLANVLEMGAAFHYADEDWTHASAVGVLDLPGHRALWDLTGSMTIGTRRPRGGFGLTMDGSLLSIPYARYRFVGPMDLLWEDIVGDGDQYYQMESTANKRALRVRAAFGGTVDTGFVDFSGGLAVCPLFNNIGFSRDPMPAFQIAGFSLIPTADVGVEMRPMRVDFQLYAAAGAALSTDGLDSGVGGRVSVEFVGGRQDPLPPAAAPYSAQ